jgi:hypothetical protein
MVLELVEGLSFTLIGYFCKYLQISLSEIRYLEKRFKLKV